MITSATTSGTTVTVSGNVNTLASVTGLTLHFYATAANGNINLRQGRRYLGSTTVNTDASGNATFTGVNLTGFTGSVAAGELITATATTPGTNGNTSEFSLGVVATASTGNSTPTGMELSGISHGGLTINTGSTNATYLQADDGSAIVGGRTQLTLEFNLKSSQAMPDNTGYSLVSYSTPTIGDGVFIGAFKSGASESIYFQINGSTISLNTDLDAIFDGKQHAFAATWSQTNGAWQMYVDGVSIGSGTGLATGGTIGTGGDLQFGMDQDAGAGTWLATPGSEFEGTFYDIRVFSDVRTSSEILASYHGEVPHYEGNLVANWRFNDLSVAGVTTDSITGNNLTVRQVSRPGFTAGAATLTLNIDENLVTGTAVGSVSASDLDREAKISQLLAADSTLRYSAETGKFYKLFSSTLDATTAQTTAVSTTLAGISGQLVTIRSAAENELMWGFAQTVGGSVWLNGQDSITEGVWRWYSGTSANDPFWVGAANGVRQAAYTNWNATQPNDLGGAEDAMRIDSADGLWYDAGLTGANHRYVVEWNADDVLDVTHALTYSITSQTVSGAFSINSDTGIISVANSKLLNYEAQTSHTVNVRVTDGSGRL